MKKRMEDVQVRADATKHLIFIEQPNMGSGERTVAISPDQVGVLISWLKEAQTWCKRGKGSKRRSPKKPAA